MSLQVWRKIPDDQLRMVGIDPKTNKNKAIPLHVQNGGRPQNTPFRCANGKYLQYLHLSGGVDYLEGLDGILSTTDDITLRRVSLH